MDTQKSECTILFVFRVQRVQRQQAPFARRVRQEVRNTLFCHLQEKFHTAVLKCVRNISGAL